MGEEEGAALLSEQPTRGRAKKIVLGGVRTDFPVEEGDGDALRPAWCGPTPSLDTQRWVVVPGGSRADSADYVKTFGRTLHWVRVAEDTEGSCFVA